MTNRHLLLDGNNILMRSIYGTQHSEMSYHGVPTGAITAFINSIAAIIREERPTHVAVAWDAVGDTHRHALSADYKANRRKGPVAELKEASFPLARRFITAAHIDQELRDGWEADDIIAAWWRMIELETADDRIIIASSDKDFIQLLGSNPHGVDTELVRLSSADTPTDRWDLDRVQQNGHEPEHWPMITALTGDPSDNVIGIDGIGPVKARKLLDRSDWDLERAIQEVPEHADRVRLNYTLVNLRDAAPANLRVFPPNLVELPEASSVRGGALTAFFTQYGLNGAFRRFRDGELWTPSKPKKIPGRSLPLW